MPFSRDQMAARLATGRAGRLVRQLGIGIPTMVANHVPPERE
jgi:acyl CoA:acetate/3-ketoacid CoA transferase beta subunit